MSELVARLRAGRFQEYMLRGPKRTDEVLRQFKEKGKPIVIRTMRGLVPMGKTGLLRESIAAHDTPYGFSVGPTVPYAKFVDQGTRPHRIWAGPTKRALRWFGPYGEAHFALYVEHPGFKPRNFMFWTSRVVAQPLEDLMLEIWTRVHG